MRVLFLASFFPRPDNPTMGTWALGQAQALNRHPGVVLRTVSLNPLLPRAAAVFERARAFASCPPTFDWDDLHVEYPSWAFYQIAPITTWSRPRPRLGLHIGWKSARTKLLRIVEEFRPDIVFSHHTSVNGYVASQIRREAGIPFVVTDHDFDEIASCADMPARRRLYQEIIGSAERNVLVARRMETDVLRIFPGARTSTVYNGVEPIPPRLLGVPRPEALRGKTVFFSAGFFYSRKGFPLLVRAFSEVARRHENCVLRIAGDGPDRAEVVEAIRAAGLENRVFLLGKVPRLQVLQEMVWADVFALVGWDEPFATVYIEAAAAKKPLIIANDGGFNDLFRNGVHGISVPPRDESAASEAMVRLAEEPGIREAMGAAAHALWEGQLTWSANASAMYDIFRDSVTGRRAGTPSGP